MTVMNVVRRKADVAQIISEDPWTIVYYRKGETPDDAPTTWTYTGRVQPAGMRSVAIERWSMELKGEHTVGRYSHCILAPAGTAKPRDGDTVVCTSQLDPSVVRKCRVIFAGEYSYKVEVLVDELE